MATRGGNGRRRPRTPESAVLRAVPAMWDDLARRADDPVSALWARFQYRPPADVAATHVVVISGWRPALLNELMGSRWRAHKLKKRDRRWVEDYFVLFHRVPRAVGRRRVHLGIRGRYRGGRFPDPDSPWKSLLDALVHSGMLRDDSAEWCELRPPRFATRADGFETTVILEDLH